MPTFEELPNLSEKELLIEIYKKLVTISNSIGSFERNTEQEFKRIKNNLRDLEYKIKKT